MYCTIEQLVRYSLLVRDTWFCKYDYLHIYILKTNSYKLWQSLPKLVWKETITIIKHTRQIELKQAGEINNLKWYTILYNVFFSIGCILRVQTTHILKNMILKIFIWQVDDISSHVSCKWAGLLSIYLYGIFRHKIKAKSFAVFGTKCTVHYSIWPHLHILFKTSGLFNEYLLQNYSLKQKSL